MATKKGLVEAALFVSDKPLSLQRLMKIANTEDSSEIVNAIAEIKRELENDDKGIELSQTPEGFEFRVKSEYRDKIRILAPMSDLSEGMMRSLAIVAIKQPIKQSIIIRYQGNKAYNYLKGLEEKGLIRSQKSGRTKTITTTQDFEKYFGKTSEEMKKILQAKMEEK